MLILLLLLTIVPLWLVGGIAISEIMEMKQTALANVNMISASAVADSTNALNNLGEDMIRRIAEDVAKQLEIYIRENPEMTVEELQKDDYFRQLAVQPVGETGYTAITDVDTLVCRFHASNKIENLDLHTLAEKLPGFWSVMSRTEGGYPSEGYYDWEDPDGSIRQKYMYIALVNTRTADGVQFSVAATTYISEFNSPINDIKSKMEQATSEISTGIELAATKVRYKTILLIIALAVFIVITGFVFARSITTPLNRLRDAGNRIAEGQLDVEMPIISTKDEVKELSDTMNLLTGALRYLRKEQNEKKRGK